MWFLKGPKDEIYYLFCGKHVVGRKNCDLVLDNDQSISRAHAIIQVTHSQSNWGNPTEKPVVCLSDAGSKYGTSLITGNDKTAMEKDVKRSLKDGDVIHFGLQFNKWKLCYEPLVVVLSSLPKSEKQKVRTIVGELGGYVVAEWHPHTSHLTMINITMTVKAISALAHAKPIVVPQYWCAYQTATKSRTELPKCEDYIPPIGETVLNEHKVSFLANSKRRSLFNGKTFYFFSEPQFKDHGCMIQAAGGVPKLVRALRHTQLKHFVETGAVAMQLLATSSQSLTLSQTPEAVTEVCEFLRTHNKRMIPASEIGLAVLHCSVEKYCNPDFNFSSMLLRNSESTQKTTPEKIIATETQDSIESTQILSGGRKVIPDSGTESKVGESGVESSVVVGAEGLESLSQRVTQPFSQRESLSQRVTQPFSQPESLSLKVTQPESQASASSLTQVGPGGSLAESQGPFRRGRLANHSKRLRIDESDEEVEILSPRKLPATAASARRRVPEVVTVEENSSDGDLCSSTPVSSSRARLNTPRASCHNDDSNDANELFTSFKESEPKSGKSSVLKCPESPEMDTGDTFIDFQEEVKPSAAQKVAEPHRPQLSSLRDAASPSPAYKRDLPLDEESGPPEKRFARMDLSRPCDSPTTNEDDDQFMVTTPVKKEDSSIVKPSYNVSVLFKPLMLSKSKNTSIAPTETSLQSSGVVNYKKFKKANAHANSIIPQIIGGRDLQVYRSCAGNTSVFCGTNEAANESDEEEGPNTLWGTLTQKAKPKRTLLSKF